MKELQLESPIFVLSAARSGSTLLRLALNQHPDLFCPPEANIATALEGLVGVIRSVSGGRSLEPGDVAALRQTIDTLMTGALRAAGKVRWCDKSLVSVASAALLRQVWPEARFICLYRHAMDFINSALEACPWGLTGYGFDRYAALFPSNSVLALAHYWIDATEAMCHFEEVASGSCAAVRYEDLVAGFARVMEEIWDFIGVSPIGTPLARRFSSDWAPGPGDHKVWFRDAVDGASLGGGFRVPVQLLPPEPRATMNELLKQLGYESVDESWGSCGRLEGLDGAATPLETDGTSHVPVRVVITEQGCPVSEAVMLVHGHSVVKVVRTDQIRRVSVVVVMDAQAWRHLRSGTNLGTLLRRRDIRSFGALSGTVMHDVLKAVGEWLSAAPTEALT